MTDDPTFEQRVQERIDAELRAAWGFMLNDPRGQRVVWSILEKCHVFHSTYTGNAETYFREGERSVGLKMLQDHIFPLGAEYLGEMMRANEARREEIEMAIAKDEQDD